LRLYGQSPPIEYAVHQGMYCVYVLTLSDVFFFE
jgi:hypothetical protein